jgi:hypothetical protein
MKQTNKAPPRKLAQVFSSSENRAGFIAGGPKLGDAVAEVLVVVLQKVASYGRFGVVVMPRMATGEVSEQVGVCKECGEMHHRCVVPRMRIIDCFER